MIRILASFASIRRLVSDTMNFNKAIILGNITKDIEQKTLPSGQAVANFGLATNRFYNDQNGAKQQVVEFHNIVAFGKLGEICARYLTKGSLVLIEGRIQTRSWADQSGVKKYRTEIIAENMQMGPRRQGSEGGFTNQNESNHAPAKAQFASTPVEEIPVISADEGYSEEKEEIDPKNVPF